jgi:pimeloyl-ACP methyl ester carboxylesterase
MADGKTTAVLLHGQPGDRSDWDRVVALLPPAIDPLALDRPGYGDNQRPAGTLADNARWLVERLDADGIDDAVLVGHSYGGGVAMAVAALAPERVRGLVLVAGVGPGCVTGWDELLAAPVVGPMLSIAAWTVGPWLARQLGNRRPSRAEPGSAPSGWQALAGVRHRNGEVWRSFLTEQRELLRDLDSWTDRLAGSPMPALIMADPMDKVVPISTAHALHAQLPNSRLELVDQGGHHLPRRIPQVVAGKIGDFVYSVDAKLG